MQILLRYACKKTLTPLVHDPHGCAPNSFKSSLTLMGVMMLWCEAWILAVLSAMFIMIFTWRACFLASFTSFYISIGDPYRQKVDPKPSFLRDLNTSQCSRLYISSLILEGRRNERKRWRCEFILSHAMTYASLFLLQYITIGTLLSVCCILQTFLCLMVWFWRG